MVFYFPKVCSRIVKGFIQARLGGLKCKNFPILKIYDLPITTFSKFSQKLSFYLRDVQGKIEKLLLQSTKKSLKNFPGTRSEHA
jgi:hypothetical protein